MLAIALSKPASYFVGRFLSVGPSAENFVVRNVLRRATEVFPFKALQFFDYLRGSFGICNAETALALEGQFDHNFSHGGNRSEEHTSELQSQSNLVCRLLLEKKKNRTDHSTSLWHVTSIRLPSPCSSAEPCAIMLCSGRL